jgi:Leucine-rich repeat (LRR) protein
MDTASKDILFTIAINLELPSLLRWCESNKRINRDVCNNDHVWRAKLLKDYPDYKRFNLKRSLKETSVFMYQLEYIKKLLNTDKTLYEIFLRDTLNLSFKDLDSVPAFDLPNLGILLLKGNKLKHIPTFNLPNLRVLSVSDNNLEDIPALNFPNLVELSLYGNKLKQLPEMVLPNLRVLSLARNKFTHLDLPHMKFPKLTYLDFAGNQLSLKEKERLMNMYGAIIKF